MKILTSILASCLLCCLSLNSFAQKNFSEGYYISNQGDTVRCLINDRNWLKNPETVQLKLTASGEVVTYQVADIKGFGLATGDVYVREEVSIDQTKNKINPMLGNIRPEPITDIVFLRILVRGKATLLLLDDGERQHFYYQAEGHKPEELLLSYYLKENAYSRSAPQWSSGTSLVTQEKYRGQLVSYFMDCPVLQDKIKRARYTANSLSDLFSKYNSCADNQTTIAPREQIKISYGLVGGPTMVNLRFISDFRKDLAGTNFETPLSYTAGVSLNIQLPRNRQKWSIQNDLRWKPYKASGKFEESRPGAYEHRTYTTEFVINCIGLSSMLRYQAASSTIKPYINVGIANNFNLKSRNHQTIHIARLTVEEIQKGKGVHLYRSYEPAAIFGAGLNFYQASVEVRGETGSAFAGEKAVVSKKSMLSLLLGYRFN
ncbi:outer membrane beta-barrel protein [Pontibacter beigongshangensis]|uniref:outer membrane beta-barrel protein n=1 Tax=Pontibacter beigongshangensis TaxID=2574733 RepID=UPI001650AB74|nr:outer membrane beta-barrel protein [Pontibacter beigongshangensis]